MTTLQWLKGCTAHESKCLMTQRKNERTADLVPYTEDILNR